MALLRPKLAVTESALHMFRDVESELLHSTREPALRIGRTSHGLIDPQTIRRESTYLRYLSICEAYTDTVLVDLLDDRVPRPTPPEIMLMMEDLEITASRNWSSRNAAFQKYFGIALSGYNDWARFQAATDARNVIAHGLGRLTASQRGNRSLPKKLASIDVALGGGRIHLSAASLSTVRDLCLEYVKYLDGMIP
jgi:hypothetical protein